MVQLAQNEGFPVLESRISAQLGVLFFQPAQVFGYGHDKPIDTLHEPFVFR